MSVASPLNSELIMEDTPSNLTPAMVDREEVREGIGKEPPLVFLNACEVGGAGASLSLVAGFPAAFIGGGAAAVVCPLWVIHDERAMRIAEHFYDAALGREPRPLGEIMREIRAKWQGGKHLTYLAYVLYGDPLLQLELRA
jgi:CHAT domain-containing protein